MTMPEHGTTDEARDEVISRNGWALTLLSILVGVAIIGCHMESGGRRWGAPTWRFALQVPGSPATWGCVILLAGLVMLYGRMRTDSTAYHIGCSIAFTWFIVLTGASTLAFLSDDSANPLSPIVWGYVSYIFALRFKLSGKAAYE